MKTIGKHLKPVIVLLLALVMLFTVGATAVFAADEAEQQTESASLPVDNTGKGENITGWLDVTYGENGVTLTLTPSIAEIKGITKDEIISLAKTLIAAFKEVAVDDIKEDYIGSEESVTRENFIDKTTTLYIRDILGKDINSEDGIVEFISEIVVNKYNNRGTFIEFSCSLLATAVKIGAVKEADLPAADTIADEVHKYADAKIEDYINDKTAGAVVEVAVLDEYCMQTFGMDYAGLMACVDSFDNEFAAMYASAVKGAGTFSPKELLLMINSIQIGKQGDALHEIFGVDEFGNKKLGTSNIIELVKTLPTFDEILNMSADEMYLSYDFYLDTIYGDSDFNITLVASPEAYKYIHRAAEIISNHFSIAISDDGTVSVDVKMPAIFTTAVLKACETGKIPESLKDKVFTAISETPDGAYTFFQNLEYSEIITILEKIDFEDVLNREQVKKYVELIDKYIDKVELQTIATDAIIERIASAIGKDKDQIKKHVEIIDSYIDRTDLATLTNEQIISKLEELAPHFNTLKNLVAKVYDKVPDGIKNKDIFDLYEGNGVFGASVEKYNINVADYIIKFVSKVNAGIAEDLALFIDNVTIDVKFDLDVIFQDIYSVEFYVPGEAEPYRAGFLPVGATLATFADKTTTPDGKIIFGWVNKATGALVTKMPAGDAQIEALVVDSIKSPIGFEGACDGTVFTLEAGAIGNYDLTALGANVSYQWYKNGAAITGATAATIDLKEITDSGEYYCVITVTTAMATKTYTTDKAVVRIDSLEKFTKVEVNTADIKFLQTIFNYTGEEHTVVLDPASYNGALVKVEIVGGTFTATNAGTYGALIKISLVNEENTLLYVDGVQKQYKYAEFTKNWEITKKTISLGDFSFALDGNKFTYNGKEQSVTLVNADTELVKFILGGVTKATDAGKYIANVILNEIDANHQLVGPGGVYGKSDTVATLEWNINAIRIDYTKFTIINKADLDAAIALFELADAKAEYNEQTQTFVLNTTGLDLPDGLAVLVIEYEGDTEGKYPGKYDMTVLVKIAPEYRKNYILVDENDVAVSNPDEFVERDFTWEIEPRAVYYDDIKEAIKLDSYVFVFDGEEHYPVLDAEALLKLPEGIEVLEFISDGGKAAGKYTAIVVVKNTNQALNIFYDKDGAVTDKVIYVLEWKIAEKAVSVDTLGIGLKQNTFVYNGSEFAIELKDLTNSDFKFELVGDLAKTVAGNYKVQVRYLGTTYNDYTLVDKDGYEIAAGTILPAKYDLTWSILKKAVSVKYDGLVASGALVYNGAVQYVGFGVSYDPALVKVTETGISATDAKADYNAIIKIELLDKDNYVLVVNGTDDEDGEFTDEKTWAIEKAKAEVFIGELVGANGLVYNGVNHVVNFSTLVYDKNLVTVSVKNNSKTDANVYEAEASIVLNDAIKNNYDLYVNGEKIAENKKDVKAEWTIAKASFDMSSAFLKNESTSYYDGTAKTHILAGVTLPAGITYTVSYYDAQGNALESAPTMVGHYKAVAKFTVSNGNYNNISDMEESFIISALPINFEGTTITYDPATFVYDASAKAFVVNTPANIADFVKYFDITLVYTDENGNKVDSVINAGTYTVSAVISVKPQYVGLYTAVNTVIPTETVTIAPRVIDLSGAVIEMSGDAAFDGAVKNFIITVGGEDVTKYITFTLKFTTDPEGTETDALKAGNYVASIKSLAVKAEHGTGNVILEGNPFSIEDLKFEITKKSIDLTGAKLEFADGNVFSAKEKEVLIKLANGEYLPSYIKLTFTDSTTGAPVVFRNVATYNVDVTFEIPEEYKDSCELIGGPTVAIKNIRITRLMVALGTATVIPVIDGIEGDTAPYTGTVKDFTVSGIALPAGVALESIADIVYEIRDENGNVVTDMLARGTYTITVTSITLKKTDVAPDAANYQFAGRLKEQTFTVVIERGTISLDGVGFAEEDLVVNYDGFQKILTLTGYIPGVIDVKYINNIQTNIGVYHVTAILTLTDPENYNPISPDNTVVIEADFEIKSNPKSFFIKDSSGKIIAEIIAQNGIPEGYELSHSDMSFAYDMIKFSDALDIKYKNKLAKIVTAYDLNFVDANGDIRKVNDNFTIKLLLPEAAKGNTNLIAVYINDDGVVEYEIPYIDDNGYIVFDTDHFSTYALAEVVDEPVEDDSKFPWWIILIIVIAIIIIIIVVIVIKKKSSKPTEPTEPTEEAPIEPVSDEEAAEEETTEEPVVEEPVVEEPVAEEPVVEEPVVEEPVAEEPVVEEPVVEEPVVEEPVVEEPVVEEPVAEEPVVEEPVVEEPVVEEPVAEEPVVEEPVAEETAPEVLIAIAPVTNGDEDESVGQRIINGQVVLVSYRSSYMSRLIQADTEIQDYYTVIKNTLLSYKGVKSRVSWNFESFNKGRVQCAKLNLKGRALLVYIGLDPNEYNVSKYHFVDVSDKPKFEKVPMLMKVKSDRGLKYVLELIEEMMLKNEIPQGEMPNEDYHMPYETTEELVKRDLVKVILPPGVTLDENSNIEKVDVGELIDNANANKAEEAPVEEVSEVAEEAPVEEVPEVAEEAPIEEVPEVAEEAPIEEVPEVAEEAPIEEAPEVAEEAPIEEYPEVVEEAPAEEVTEVAEEAPIEEAPEVVEEAPIEEAPEVVEEAPAEEVTEVAEEAPAEEVPEVVEEIHVDAIQADELLTDEEAESKIEVVARTSLMTSTKMAEINLDTICENYEDGETVEIGGLQEKRLVNKKAGRIKVLARGVMTKRLTVVADKFSLQAVKMITLAGGTAEQLK